MPRKPPPTSRSPDAPAPDPSQAANDILARAQHAGFALAGIAPAQASNYQQELRNWLAAAKHGDMDYLTEDLATRLDPTRILEGTKSFIVVADMYASRWHGHPAHESQGLPALDAQQLSDAKTDDRDHSFLNTESTERAQRAQRENSVEAQNDNDQTPSPPLSSNSSPSALSVLSVLKNEPLESSDSHKGRVARYAQGKNYHDVMKRRLHKLADQLRIDYPGSEFRTCVDTAPVNERELAALAGLGWQAKNTLIINQRLGSYMLLGVVATTLDLTPSMPRECPKVPDCCGTCTRCIDACPTQAITPYSVNATRCISYLTIENRGVIDPTFFKGIDNWIFGCDVCQEVCPHNSPRTSTGAAGGEALRRSPGSSINQPSVRVCDTVLSGATHAAYSPKHTSFDLLQVLGWSEQDRRAAFTNSPMKRATLAMMKRNALIALGNKVRELEAAAEQPTSSTPATTLRARIAQVATDPSEPDLTRQTAAAVLQWLARGPSETPR